MSSELLERIETLRQSLAKIGYYPFQLDLITKEITGSSALEKCRPEQLEDLVRALEDQLAFARKCLDLGKRERSAKKI